MTLRPALVVLGLILASCGGSERDQVVTPRSRAAQQPASPTKVATYEDENSVGMSDQRVSRWRWKGQRQRCYFVVDNQCFDSKKAACQALGCKLSECKADDRAPAEVTCAGGRGHKPSRG
jgi:hypothetical protein